MDHQGTPPGPVRIRVLRLRRGAGQTRSGRALKRLLGREIRIPARTEPDSAALIAYPDDAGLPAGIRDDRILDDALAGPSDLELDARRANPRPSQLEPPNGADSIKNVVFVSHSDFTGNSALHVYAIACELHQRGLSPVVAVPENPGSVDDVGRPPFPVLTYAEALTDALQFPDGRGPDLVHAFSPRELVRQVTVELVRLHCCRYVVHLEDNDEVVLSGELGGADLATLRTLPLPVLDRIIQPRQSHPLRATRFLERAAGITVLIDRLLELVPEGVPAAVIHAGFDEAVLAPLRPRDEVRAELRLAPDDLAILYTGNVHSLNRGEMRELYAAVGLLRRAGRRAVLVKTGWGSGVAAEFPSLGRGIRDLGWVPRSSIAELLAAADVLVQPGRPDPFNDYRFPSKLPEYLASGRPVVLPRTNVGLELRDGEDALLLDRGDAAEIAAAVGRLADDPALRARLGEAGRAFALRELRWPASVDRVEQLFREIAAAARPPAPAWALDGADPPVKLVAFVPVVPTEAEAEAARADGIYGFCLDAGAVLLHPSPLTVGFPFCLRLDDAGRGVAEAAIASFASQAYIRIGGAPLLLGRESLAAKAGCPRLVSTPEDVPVADGDYGALMRASLATPLPDHTWFRALLAPVEPADAPVYSTWLRKLVLQTALRAPAKAPFLFVDASRAWSRPSEREAWLAATRSGMRQGIRQFYASQHLRVSADEADLILRTT
jgi:glycosyltransferase involved in cell wall biosynthesis